MGMESKVVWSARGAKMQDEVRFEGSSIAATEVLKQAAAKLSGDGTLALYRLDQDLASSDRQATASLVPSDSRIPTGAKVYVQQRNEAQLALMARLADPDTVFARSPSPVDPPENETDERVESAAAMVAEGQPMQKMDEGDDDAERPRVPRQLLCPVTGGLLVTAVVLPCCQETVNQECAKPGKPCPISRCRETLPQRLVPDKRVRKMANQYAVKIRKWEEETEEKAKMQQQQQQQKQLQKEQDQYTPEPDPVPPPPSGAALDSLLASIRGASGADLNSLLREAMAIPGAAALLNQALPPGESPLAAQPVPPPPPSGKPAKSGGGFRPLSDLNLEPRKRRRRE
eukprot:Hpha_TRINITY_DN2301_c0_g2::TRINITY_DN2301_c0_g2_i1::g.499::m.499